MPFVLDVGSKKIASSGRPVRVGYFTLLFALLIPGRLDLARRAITPPLPMPLEAAGLLLVALGVDDSEPFTRMARRTLLAKETLLLRPGHGVDSAGAL